MNFTHYTRLIMDSRSKSTDGRVCQLAFHCPNSFFTFMNYSQVLGQGLNKVLHCILAWTGEFLLVNIKHWFISYFKNMCESIWRNIIVRTHQKFYTETDVNFSQNNSPQLSCWLCRYIFFIEISTRAEDKVNQLKMNFPLVYITLIIYCISYVMTISYIYKHGL